MFSERVLHNQVIYKLVYANAF